MILCIFNNILIYFTIFWYKNNQFIFKSTKKDVFRTFVLFLKTSFIKSRQHTHILKIFFKFFHKVYFGLLFKSFNRENSTSNSGACFKKLLIFNEFFWIIEKISDIRMNTSKRSWFIINFSKYSFVSWFFRNISEYL